MEHIRQDRAECLFVCSDGLRGERWDPGYWHPRHAALAGSCRLPCVPLGSFVEHITYGPILPGRRPEPVADGVAIIGLKAVRATGVLLAKAVTVAEGCAYDVPRCRLRPRDIVLCRSGVGALGRRRFTVFHEQVPATVSCFVDLIRVCGISPYYVVTFLRSRLGWAQIERQINGVGTPNVSFAEICALAIPRVPQAEQAEIEAAWSGVHDKHAAGDLEAAQARLDAIVSRLDERLLSTP